MRIYITILFLVIFSSIISQNDTILSSDIIVNNLIVNNVEMDGAQINAENCEIGGSAIFDLINSITFVASPEIYFNDVNISDDFLYLLVLDKDSNQLKFTKNKKINNLVLNTNLIESEDNTALNIGLITDKVNINAQTVQFANQLNCNDINFNTPININSECHFLSDLTVNSDLVINRGIVTFENSNKITDPISIKCTTLSTADPISLFGTMIISNENNDNNITIGTLTGNVIIGSKEFPINTINGLPVITNPIYYLVSDNDGTVKKYEIAKYSYIVQQDAYTNSILNASSIKGGDSIHITSTNTFLIKANNIKMALTKIVYINMLDGQSCFASNGILLFNGLDAKNLTVNVNNTLNVDCITPIGGKYPMAGMVFDFYNYFFYNMPLMSDLSNISLYIEPSGLLTKKNVSGVELKDIDKKNIIKKLDPVIFTYKEEYQMNNNDMCYKNNSKINHFGFLAEDLEQFEIENLIIKHHNQKIVDYNNEILMEIMLEKLNFSEFQYQFLIKKYSELENKVKKLKEKNNTKKNIINQKKNLIKLIQTTLNNV